MMLKNKFFKWLNGSFLNEAVEEDDLEEDELLIDTIHFGPSTGHADDEEYDYTLTQTDSPTADEFTYRVYDPDTILVARWKSKDDAANMSTMSEYPRSTVKRMFNKIVYQEEEERKKKAELAAKKANLFARNSELEDEEEWDPDEEEWDTDAEEDRPLRSFGSYGATGSRTGSSRSAYSRDDDDDLWWLSGYNSSGYKYTPPSLARKTGYLDKLNKSDTLVVHKDDPSTTMLAQIYEGKGWDVLTDSYIDKDEMHELLKSHDRIVMLGHGTSYGLMGGNIGPEEAPYLKDKKLFVIWCNADKYFKQHGIGNGQFIVDNVPSEVGESVGAGCGKISKELMLENITYWSKLCADVVEQALEGDVDNAVEYVRKNYLEKYGNHPVTIYNAYSTDKHDLKTPLPKYEFKGEPLTEKDYPYPGYNEEEFLKNPKSTINGRSPYAS